MLLVCVVWRPGMTAYSLPLHQEHAFAINLPVEQLIGLAGLIDIPAMGEQFVDVDVDAALDRKPCAIRLEAQKPLLAKARTG